MAVASDVVNSVLIEYLDKQAFKGWSRDHAFLDYAVDIVEAGGSGARIPIQTPSASGIGADFGVALDGAPTSGFLAVGFQPTPAVEYGHDKIQWAEAALASDKRTSPLDIPMTATKNASASAMESMANTLIGGHAVAGAWAKIASYTNPSGTLYRLVLSPITDAAKFSQGTYLVSKQNAAANLDAGSPVVVGVSPGSGVITVDAQASGWTPTANYYIAPKSLMVSGTSIVGLFPSVFTWIPPAANRTLGSPEDTLYGVPRTLAASNVPFVSGFGFTANGPIWQAVYACAANMVNVSNMANPNLVFCNPLVLPTLAQSAQAQVVRMPARTKNADFGFQGFEVVGPKSTMKVLADPSFPINQILVSKEGSWPLFKPQGGMLQPATNGKVIIDRYDGTVSESRASVMCVAAGFGCREPVSNAVITIANPSVIS